LQKAKPGPITSDCSEVTKTKALKNAGLSMSTAHEYEQLAGPLRAAASRLPPAAASLPVQVQEGGLPQPRRSFRRVRWLSSGIFAKVTCMV
jgi:hypothetical protein